MAIEQDRQTEPSQYRHDQECDGEDDGIAEIDLKSGLAEQIGVNRADRPVNRHIRLCALPVRERNEEGVADKSVDKDEDDHGRRRKQQRRKDALQGKRTPADVAGVASLASCAKAGDVTATQYTSGWTTHFRAAVTPSPGSTGEEVRR